MSGFFGFLRVFGAVGVILLLQVRVAWAEEATVRGLSSTVYGGAGTLTEPNNETLPDLYDVKRVGLAAFGVWRSAPPRASERNEESGFFGVFGAGYELEDSSHRNCNYDGTCYRPAGGHHLGAHLAARLGFGYSWRLFEFRLGVLGALPDAKVSYALPLVMPDAQLRFGNRGWGWFEVGLGAYDASTNLRPGIYVGAAFGPVRVVRVSAHAGVHLVNGLCCSTVTHIGYRYELGATRALSDALSVGAGFALLQAEDYLQDELVGEGRASIAWAF
ncbi:MAG TPA: hypothetical protein VHB79_29795 [Polyangiaceae bacterium]|nr:hypothetical protein [Polyangiaceae bacterium]